MSIPPPIEVPVIQPKSSPLKFIVRIGVGVGVLAFLIVRSDAHAIWAALREARVEYVVLASLTLFLGIFVSALRWHAYLKALELSMPMPTLLRMYFVGTFFNAFLPTGVGGDAYKALRIGRATDNLTGAFASVFLDRFAGLLGLAALGLTGVVTELIAGDTDLNVARFALLLCAGIIVAGTVLLTLGEKLLGPTRFIGEHGFGGKLRGAVRAIHATARHPQAAAEGYMYGFVFSALAVTYHVFIARALGIGGVPLGALIGIVVVASLATMIPITINGLGFREAAYAWGLGRFSVAHDQAFAFALLVLVILLLTSLAGGIVYVIAGGEVERRHFHHHRDAAV